MLQVKYGQVATSHIRSVSQSYTGDCMYTVSIQWGNTAATHTAWSLASAKEWLYKYPNKDMFGKVTDLFGRTLAVRYYR